MPDFTIGDIVTVRGYGGYAEVLSMEEDGITPQGHPKYLCTVRFGPYDEMHDKLHVDLPFGPVRKKSRDRVHQFYAGRLKNIFSDAEEQHGIGKAKKNAEQSAAARDAELKATLIEMALLRAELND